MSADPMTLERWKRSLEAHIYETSAQMTRQPAGQLKHPYTSPARPGSALYSDNMWDMPTWRNSIVMGQVEQDTDARGRFAAFERGSILNFLDHADEDGVMPVQMTPEGSLTHGDASRAGGFAENMHRPCLAQHAALLVRRSGDSEWIRPHLAGIGRYLERYLESHVHGQTGLAYWQSDSPCVSTTIRPFSTDRTRAPLPCS